MPATCCETRKVRNRVGRGASSGNGKTWSRQKGQKTAVAVRLGFEGTNSLFRRNKTV